nr:unnamed protein product [Digitaria exilis]
MAGDEGPLQLRAAAAAAQLGLPEDCSTKKTGAEAATGFSDSDSGKAIAPQSVEAGNTAKVTTAPVGIEVASRGKPLLTQATVDWILAHTREPFSGLSNRDLNPHEPQELVHSVGQTMLEAAEFHEGVEDEVGAMQERLRCELDTRGFIELDDDEDCAERVADINAISSAAFLEAFGCGGLPSDCSDPEDNCD